MAPSWQHALGTSPYGHDLVALCLFSAAKTGLQALWATAWTMMIGVVVGLVAAARPAGLVDHIQSFVARICDSISPLFIAACVATIMPRMSPWQLGPLIALVAWPNLSNVVRSEAVVVFRSTFVESARAIGAGGIRIAVHYILPEMWERVGALCLSFIPGFVGVFGALGFIGVGTSSELGVGFLLFDSHNYLRSQPWYFAAMLLSFLALMTTTSMISFRRSPLAF
jgi:peptide/nickel transport system permease protein